MRFCIGLIISTGLAALSACSSPIEDSASDSEGVLLRWNPPSTYDDGGALPDAAVSEYRIYVDQQMVQRVEPELSEYFLELGPGAWAVTISAVVNGVESRLSEPLDVVVDPP